MKNDRWTLTEEGFDPASLAKQESIFSLGNGYLGMRGFYEERRPSYHPGVFVNGFYELEPIRYGERAYGYAENNQTMLDLPDARFIEIFADGDPVQLTHGMIHAHSRSLDMRHGVLKRMLDWESEKGARLVIRWESLISYTHQHLGAVSVTVTPVSCDRVEIHSSIAMPISRKVDADDPRVSSSKGPSAYIIDHIECGEWPQYTVSARLSTKRSRKVLCCGAVHTEIRAESVFPRHVGDEPFPRIVCSSQHDSPLSLTKLFLYITGDDADGVQEQYDALADSAASMTFQELREEQYDALKHVWESCAVEIQDDRRLEQVLRFNMFQLYQSAGKDGATSLAAKGLTGGGYEGHYFWDTEIYALPFFTFTQPEIARRLLEYRISTIPQARERAVQMRQRGILFPWRTINGYEASAYFPAGTAQYHINADIVYSLMTYVQMTGDDSIMHDGGAELLFETARFWYDLGFFSERHGGAFCIHEVTGPDEYSALVNNNLYTNVMAKYNLEEAAAFYRQAAQSCPELLESIKDRIHLQEHEPEGWLEAAEKMFLPFDMEMGIHPQDECFLDRERWDFSSCPEDHYPLLLHYHPLNIYRFQVLKQADVVLAHFLRPNEFPWYEKLRDYYYYEDLTTGDSSLSACIQGIMAFEMGDIDRGIAYCRKTALMDMDDYQGNVKDGLHTAAMAGSWLSLVFGLAGMRIDGGRIRFAPVTHRTVPSYSCRIMLHGCRLQVAVGEKDTRYQLIEGESLEIEHHGQLLRLHGDETVAAATNPPFRAVIFDLDGVITSTDKYHYLAWKQLADELGWMFDEQVNQQLRGVSRRESLEIICSHNRQSLSEDEIAQYMEKKNSYYRGFLQSLTAEDLLPGFLELCADLKERGIVIGVASVSRNAEFILRKLGIASCIDALAPAHLMVKGKPDPEIFVRCAEMLGVPKRSCAAFEDSRVGVEAIRRGLMKCVGVGDSVSDMECDLHIDGLDQVSYRSIASLWNDHVVSG